MKAVPFVIHWQTELSLLPRRSCFLFVILALANTAVETDGHVTSAAPVCCGWTYLQDAVTVPCVTDQFMWLQRYNYSE